MEDTTVIAGNASGDMAGRLARRLEAPLVKTTLKTFSDGEGRITLSGEPGSGRIVVVQSTHPPVDTNLFQALLITSKAGEFSSDVTAVVPYMGYTRQDREFLSGEVVTFGIVAELFRAAGASKLVTVDIHSSTALDLFRFPARSVTAIPELASRFAGIALREPMAVSPDAGGTARAEEFARICGCTSAALKKRRDRKTGNVSIETTSLDVEGRDIILVDDMVSSGGSMVKAAEFLRGCGCGRILAACTHALLIGDAAGRMAEAGISQIVGANTIPGPASTVDVSGAIAGAITEMA